MAWQLASVVRQFTPDVVASVSFHMYRPNMPVCVTSLVTCSRLCALYSVILGVCQVVSSVWREPYILFLGVLSVLGIVGSVWCESYTLFLSVLSIVGSVWCESYILFLVVLSLLGIVGSVWGELIILLPVIRSVCCFIISLVWF